ncbi:MAG: hypothetical protein OXT73_06560 [Bacteroidota bacterium]|nr:hypothetical protein [Bacteroidota bacterium]
MINTLHTILVVSFVAVTGVLLAMTLVQRLRVRGVKMTWISARMGGLPVLPTVFMGVVLVFMLYSRNTVAPVAPAVFLGYFTGGILWFLAVILSASAIVTEYGIIPEAGRSGDAVGWGQVFDYFEVESERRVHFAFMYQDFLGERKRLDLSVPHQHADRFRRLVRANLDVPMEHPHDRVRRSQALNN